MGTVVFIATLIINIGTWVAAIDTLFSAAQHPQEQPREEQSISREETNVLPPDTAPDNTQPTKTPPAEER